MVTKRLKLVFVFFLFFFLTNTSHSLTTLTVMEEDLVKIEPSAIDPDQDKIVYYYSTPLNESGEWQTTLDDAGVYHTKVVASDGKSQTEEEIIIIVKNKNRPPEIKDKKFVVEEGETLDLKQLISDPDNDTLKLIFEEPFDEEGVWQTTYDDAGEYQTKIIASDLEEKVSQTIGIKVKNKNQAPEIISSFSQSELVRVREDSTFHFSVSTQDQDQDSLTYSWQLDGKEISQEASFSHYFDFEMAGEYELILVVSDQESETEKIWTLGVTDLNRPPEIELPEIIVNEGEKIILQLPETDIDGDVIVYSFQPPFEDGIWQTTYDNAGNYTATITASDGNLTAEKEIKVTINDVDRAPVTHLDEKITTNENEKLTVDLEDFFSDPDGDELFIDVKNLPGGAVFSENRLEWQPSYNFVQRKDNFFTGLLNRLRLEKYLFLQNERVELLVTACGKELCIERALKIQVDNVNRKPVLEEIKDIALTEGETVALKPKAVDPDGDYIKYRFDRPFNSKGEWETDYDDAGNYTMAVMASDGYLTEAKEVKITVLNKNRPPTLEVKKDCFKLNENQVFSFKAGAVDPDNDELTLWAEDLPEGASFKEHVFSWKPSFDVVKERKAGFLDNIYAKFSFLNSLFNKEKEQFAVNFIVSDGEFDVVHPVTLTVKNVNRVPEIKDYSAEKLTAMVDEPVTFSVDDNDADGDELTYEWSFGFWEERVKGSKIIKRTFKTPGIKTVKVEISDGIDSTEQEWKVKVNPLPVLVEPKVVEEFEEGVKEEPEPTPSAEEPCLKPAPCPEVEAPSCPTLEPAPCPQLSPPPQAPFKVYVVEG